MTPEESEALWASVQTNRKTLDACDRHHFVNEEPERLFGARHRCTRCGGHAESLHVYWYNLGLKHGGQQ